MSDLFDAAMKAKQAQFMEEFINYGLLLNSMTADEFGQEIGRRFPTQQAAIVATLFARLMACERRLGSEE